MTDLEAAKQRLADAWEALEAATDEYRVALAAHAALVREPREESAPETPTNGAAL